MTTRRLIPYLRSLISIPGRELLRHVLPENAYHKVADDFQKVKKWVKEDTK
jgi:hypothetical protein